MKINAEICRVLGIPTDCHKATITLEASCAPTVVIERRMINAGQLQHVEQRFELKPLDESKDGVLEVTTLGSVAKEFRCGILATAEPSVPVDRALDAAPAAGCEQP